MSLRAENNVDGVRMSMALTHIEPNRSRLNFTIKANVQVRRIAFDGKLATGVEVESGGETFLVEAEQITLCAGAVGSPQLLMLSGIGPSDQLGPLGIPVVVNSPGVGQNMRDHPNVVVRFTVREDRPDETAGARDSRRVWFDLGVSVRGE